MIPLAVTRQRSVEAIHQRPKYVRWLTRINKKYQQAERNQGLCSINMTDRGLVSVEIPPNLKNEGSGRVMRHYDWSRTCSNSLI